jgi:hypothetical protein
VDDELARRGDRRGETKPEDDVVESALEVRE